MLTDDEIDAIALKYLKEHYSQDGGFSERTPYSKPGGIYYLPQVQYMGDGGFFVSRKSGKIWSFGSGDLAHDRLQTMLDFYDEGWRWGNYRLAVQYVARAVQFAELLVEKRLTYTVLELE